MDDDTVRIVHGFYSSESSTSILHGLESPALKSFEDPQAAKRSFET